MKNFENNSILNKALFLEREDLTRVINGAYIAERFFGKSGSWFSQKINNNVKNGKPCDFTTDELMILSNALHTLSIELADLGDEIYHNVKQQQEQKEV